MCDVVAKFDSVGDGYLGQPLKLFYDYFSVLQVF